MRKELITLLVAVLLFAPQAEAANAIGNNAIAIGREVTAGEGADNKGQIVIGNRNQSDVWIGGWDIAAIANAANVAAWSPPTPSPARIPDPRRPAIQSGVSPASATVRGAEARARIPVATAAGGEGIDGNTVLGLDAVSTAVNGTAIGHGARAEGQGATAIGAGANLTGAYGTAIGFNALAADGVAIGAGANAGPGSGLDIAIGNASTHTRVRIGTFSINGMNDRIGTIAETANATGSAHARINDHETRLSSVESRVSNLVDVSNRLSKAVAMSMAQEFIAVERDRRARFGMTSSAYRGEFGIGASAGVRVNDRIQLHFSGAMDSGFDEKAIKAGFDIQFGGKAE